MSLAKLLFGGALLAAILGGCSAENKAKDEKLCKPGAYVFCRCQDRQEGSKQCNEAGDGYGKCEPCETDQNPEIIEGSSSSSSSSSSSGSIPTGDGGPSGGTCGDGIVQAGEDCDDKNGDDTDGCGKDCKLTSATTAATNACPGLEVHVWGGAHEPTTTGSTAGAGNRSATPTCPKSGNGATASGVTAPDRVFKVVAHKTGNLEVATSDATFNVFLYAVADGKCAGSSVPQIACQNAVDGNGNETLTFPVEAGKAYHVFVDGGLAGKQEGSFRVTFAIP